MFDNHATLKTIVLFNDWIFETRIFDDNNSRIFFEMSHNTVQIFVLKLLPKRFSKQTSNFSRTISLRGRIGILTWRKILMEAKWQQFTLQKCFHFEGRTVFWVKVNVFNTQQTKRSPYNFFVDIWKFWSKFLHPFETNVAKRNELKHPLNMPDEQLCQLLTKKNFVTL